jgi:hypothetical protein
MSARRRAEVVPLTTPPVEGASTEDELSDLAGAVWLINCGVGTNGETEKLFEALSHVERTLRRISDQVGDTERRLGWRSERKVGA